MLCIFGGIAFLIGSVQYLPFISRHTFGAVLFTVGSFVFFIADLMDWITHHFANCWRSCMQVKNFKTENRVSSPGLCCSSSYKLETALNAGLTTVGSLFYFIGCVLFIPLLRSTVIGDILFIPGSILIFISMSWKLYRTGCSPQCALDEQLNESTNRFQWRNLLHSDLAALIADISLLLGSAAFLAGSIIFLPALDVSDRFTYIAAIVFIVGSALFISSGCGLFYGYFVADYTGL